jgi:hypothetical protein
MGRGGNSGRSCTQAAQARRRGCSGRTAQPRNITAPQSRAAQDAGGPQRTIAQPTAALPPTARDGRARCEFYQSHAFLGTVWRHETPRIALKDNESRVRGGTLSCWLPNVLRPQRRLGGNELPHQRSALLAVHHHHLHRCTTGTVRPRCWVTHHQHTTAWSACTLSSPPHRGSVVGPQHPGRLCSPQ